MVAFSLHLPSAVLKENLKIQQVCTRAAEKGVRGVRSGVNGPEHTGTVFSG